MPNLTSTQDIKINVFRNQIIRLLAANFARENSPVELRILVGQWLRQLQIAERDGGYATLKDFIDQVTFDICKLGNSLPSILFILQEFEIALFQSDLKRVSQLLIARLKDMLFNMRPQLEDIDNLGIRTQLAERYFIAHLENLDPETITAVDICSMEQYASIFMQSIYDISGEVQFNDVLASFANITWLAHIVPQALLNKGYQKSIEKILSAVYARFMSITADQVSLLKDELERMDYESIVDNDTRKRKIAKNILNTVNNFLILGFVPTALEIPAQVGIEILKRDAHGHIQINMMNELRKEVPLNEDASGFWQRMLQAA